MNKGHYTMMNRATKNRVLNYFQNKGAKVHFNYMKVEDPELSEQTGSKEMIVIKKRLFNTRFIIGYEIWCNLV